MKSPFIKPILALNTATHREEVAIIKDDRVIAELALDKNKHGSSLLMETIVKLLKKAKLELSDLGGVLTIVGPGPFSAVRIGCAVANTLAFSLQIPAYAVTTEALWKVRAESFKTQPLVLIAAGKGHYALPDFENNHSFNPEAATSEHPIFTLTELVTELASRFGGKPFTVICDSNPLDAKLLKKNLPKGTKLLTSADAKKIPSLGKTLLEMPGTLIYSQKDAIVTPRYLRPPTITLSKKLSHAA